MGRWTCIVGGKGEAVCAHRGAVVLRVRSGHRNVWSIQGHAHGVLHLALRSDHGVAREHCVGLLRKGLVHKQCVSRRSRGTCRIACTGSVRCWRRRLQHRWPVGVHVQPVSLLCFHGIGIYLTAEQSHLCSMLICISSRVLSVCIRSWTLAQFGFHLFCAFHRWSHSSWIHSLWYRGGVEQSGRRGRPCRKCGDADGHPELLHHCWPTA